MTRMVTNEEALFVGIRVILGELVVQCLRRLREMVLVTPAWSLGQRPEGVLSAGVSPTVSASLAPVRLPRKKTASMRWLRVELRLSRELAWVPVGPAALPWVQVQA